MDTDKRRQGRLTHTDADRRGKKQTNTERSTHPDRDRQTHTHTDAHADGHTDAQTDPHQNRQIQPDRDRGPSCDFVVLFSIKPRAGLKV